MTVNQPFFNGSSGVRQPSLRAWGSREELFSGTICSPGTTAPTRVSDTSQGGASCLVTLDVECFHSCKQDPSAKKLGLLEKQEDALLVSERTRKTAEIPLEGTRANGRSKKDEEGKPLWYLNRQGAA